MFRRILHKASRTYTPGRVGRSIALTSGLAFAGTGVALAHSGPEKIDLADVQTSAIELSERDFDSPSQELLAEERATSEQGGHGQSAYNPVTGEINWDCPCLGGMAHGPCGPEFKEAFACFIYSTEEIKGSECIPKFSAMQNCFRQYPEVYADFQEDTQAVASADAATAARSEAADAVADAKAAAVDAKDATIAKGGEIKDSAVAKGSEIKDSAKFKADEAKQATEANLEKTKKTAEAKATEAKDAAASKLTQAQDAAAVKAREYKEAANAALEQVEATAGDKVTELKKSVASEKAKLSDSVSGAASDAAQQASSTWDDAASRLKALSKQASEIASAKTSDLASKAGESNQNLADLVTDYTTRVQQAAKEVVEEASNKSEQLNASDISELIEQKLNEAHKDAAELFANTTSPSPVQNAALFASDAVQGIAAEAKEAVNYVAKGVNDTFGKSK